MTCSIPSACIRLVLTGSKWLICAKDVGAATVITALSDVMSLSSARYPEDHYSNEQWQELQVFVDSEVDQSPTGRYESGPFFCSLPSPDNKDMLAIGMSHIALTIVRAELLRGGLLIHGALAKPPAHIGGSFLLAGPSNIGKTTTSNRLPLPWSSLSDDASLVLLDANQQYRAHPWPTWSRFYNTEKNKPPVGGKWDVQSSIPLTAIFFLSQTKNDQISPLSSTHAIACLMETVQHVSWPLTRDLTAAQTKRFHERQLTVAEAIIRAIPAYTLHISLTGSFWEKIEKTLTSGSTTSSLQPEHTPVPRINSKDKNHSSLRLLSKDNELIVRYSGPSMNPTLNDQDILQIVPCTDNALQRGDVIFFHPPTGGSGIVHRVVRITKNGICTRGDNNSVNDPYLLQLDNITGRVTASWKNGQRRKIAGGLQGIWSRYYARIYCRINKFFTPILHSIYHTLSTSGFLRYLLPASLQPRVFKFKQRYLPPILKLIINGHVIGRYDVWKKLWVIDRPWRLIIDETKLPIVAGSPPMEPPDLNKAPVKNRATQNQQI